MKYLLLLIIFLVFIPFSGIIYSGEEGKKAQKGKINLVKNGSFDKVDSQDKSKPVFWEKPDDLGVKWLSLDQRPGKLIQLNTAISEKDMVKQWKKKGITEWNIPNPANNSISDTYGLSYYSDPIEIKKGQTYQISFDFKAPGKSNGAKVWVRGYGIFRGQKRRRYETIVNCRVKDNKWHHFIQNFSPTKHRPEVTEIKVMLYAYYPPGLYYFDNIKIIPVSPKK